MKLWIPMFFASCLYAQAPPYTTIADVLPPGVNGLPVQGVVTVSWTQFNYNGTTMAQSPANGYTFPIANGGINVALVPTDHAGSQATAYKIVTTIAGNPVTTYWQVPTLPSAQCPSATTCTVKQVTVALPAGPGVAINPAQISGVVNGRVICGVGGVAAWCVETAGGLASFNGRTASAVVPASGDYAAAQVTNAADTTGSYSNHSWITALAYSKLTGVPGVPAYSAVTDGSPMAWNLGSAAVANGIVTLAHTTATRALSLTNLANGGFYTLVLKQDSTGGAALTAGTGCTWKVVNGGGGAFALTSAASGIDILTFTYDGTNCYANVQNNFN
jgi:hypothetical protein